MMDRLAQALIPQVLRVLSPEARSLIVAVVRVAKGARELGPPSPPPGLQEWCRAAAGSRAPWQLVAAALVTVGTSAAPRIPELLDLVEHRGLVSGVAAWTQDAPQTEAIILTFLTLTARELEPDGLEVLASVFATDPK